MKKNRSNASYILATYPALFLFLIVANATALPLLDLPPLPPGDMNCDGTITGSDLDPFLLAVLNPTTYEKQFPTCIRSLADLNLDGKINIADVDRFRRLLEPPVRCPAALPIVSLSSIDELNQGFPTGEEDIPFSVQLLVKAADVAPKFGEYDFTLIDEFLRRTGDRYVDFKFAFVAGDYNQKEELGRNTATPRWLFNIPGMTSLGGFDVENPITHRIDHVDRYPVYWDKQYLLFVKDLIEQFAAKYAQNPRICRLRFQVIANHTLESFNFYGEVGRRYFAPQLATLGMDYSGEPNLPLNTPATGAGFQVVTAAKIAFAYAKTAELHFTLHYLHDANEDSASRALFNHVVGARYGVNNTGLAAGKDLSATRTLFNRLYHDGVSVGWGGMTSPKGEGENWSLSETFESGVGGTEKFPIRSLVSFVTTDLLGGRLSDEQRQALQFVTPRLRKPPVP